jgi:hypothetical protein
VIALDAWATSQNLRNVELPNCPFRVVDLSSAGNGRSLCPIIRLFRKTLFVKCVWRGRYTKDGICVAEGHRRCDGGHLQGGGKGLDDAGMETGSSGGNGERIVQSLAGGRPQAGRRHAFRIKGFVFDGLGGAIVDQVQKASAAKDEFGYRGVVKESDEEKTGTCYEKTRPDQPAVYLRDSRVEREDQRKHAVKQLSQRPNFTFIFGDNAARRDGRGVQGGRGPGYLKYGGACLPHTFPPTRHNFMKKVCGGGPNVHGPHIPLILYCP